jgi:hypothetical protein
MALIIYPLPDADSFITVADADIVIGKYTLQSASWLALSPEAKENYLRIAYRDIIDHTDPTTYPDPLDACVGEAQALMAVHDLQYGLSDTQTATTGAIKKQQVGSVTREFYDVQGQVKDAVTSRVPDMAKTCLTALGYVMSADMRGLCQTLLGRS